MSRDVDGITHRLILDCYVDDLFTLYSHDGSGSLYEDFTSALAARWNVEDEGPISDLLNVDISYNTDHVSLGQQKYIEHLVETYLPDGVPLSFHKTQAPASEELPARVDKALRTKHERDVQPADKQAYQSLVGALLYCSTQT
eukprot:5139394-Pleurochrysis_carterae.AAC.1